MSKAKLPLTSCNAYQEIHEDWHLHAPRAAVSKATVCERLRRGWDFERALTTPSFHSGILKRKLVAMVEAQPGITLQEIWDQLEASGENYWTFGVVRTMVHRVCKNEVITHEIWFINERHRKRFYPVTQAMREAEDDEEWEPKPFINPIRARALGLIR